MRENIPIETYRGRFIIDTSHSIQRWYDQRGVDTFIFPTVVNFRKEIQRVIKDGIDQILDDFSDYSNTYLIHSNSTGIGVVINWRPERKGNETNHAIIVSILPIRNKHYPKYKDDTLLFVELATFLNQDLKKKILRENLQEGEYSQLKTNWGFNVILFENNIWDIDAAILYAS